MKDLLAVNAKALIAFFAPVLSYIGLQLAENRAVDLRYIAALTISAVLVWGTKNSVGG